MEMKEWLEKLSVEAEHEWVVYLGLAFLIVSILPMLKFFGVRLLSMIFKRVTGREVRPLVKRLMGRSFLLWGFGCAGLVASPTLALGRPYIEGVYLSVMVTLLMISGVLMALVWFEHFFLERMSDVTGLPLNWCDMIVFGFAFFVGVSIVLDYWGLAIAPILGSLGLLGIAVGLGAQDLFSNLISGLLIILEKRLKEGDVIEVGGVMGTVQKVNLRSTLIEQFDMTPTYIPNSMISGAISSNLTRRPHRRIVWDLGLEYRTRASALRGIRDDILSYLRENEDFLGEEEATCMVRLSEFGDSAVTMRLHCFAKTADFLEWMDVKEKLLLRVKEIVEDEHGASFAFPSMSLYSEKEVVVHAGGGGS